MIEPKRYRMLFVGECWNGSSARSLREAIAGLGLMDLDDIGEDLYRPKGRSFAIRVINRILTPLYQAELATEVLRRLSSYKPDVVVVYKGNLVPAHVVRAIKLAGAVVVNVFPDVSPHAHGKQLRDAMAEYDLVISTKPFHPSHWKRTYGYDNRCVCVPHGYDPAVHYWRAPPATCDIDVAIAASWRPQYESLMLHVSQLMPDVGTSVSLVGPGWRERRGLFPSHWQFPGPLYGRAYGDFVRQAKIVIAPVHTDLVIDGASQPGDQDTTRTYELAAAGVFFLHRRTPFAMEAYLEGSECIFWDDAEELVAAIRHYLPREEERRAIALAAHRRAVPNYSIPVRASEVMAFVHAAIHELHENDT